VIGAEKFARLENGEQNIIYLSREIAEQLGVDEGDSLLLGGM
jgi:ABC-type lipoprotein release transport system permease subunit